MLEVELCYILLTVLLVGGTAGNVLTNRLTEQQNTLVLVLEAGQSYAILSPPSYSKLI